jgi:hypothetical protein
MTRRRYDEPIPAYDGQPPRYRPEDENVFLARAIELIVQNVNADPNELRAQVLACSVIARLNGMSREHAAILGLNMREYADVLTSWIRAKAAGNGISGTPNALDSRKEL